MHILWLLFMPGIYILTSNRYICPGLNSWETPVPQLSFPWKDLIFGQHVAHWFSEVHLHFRSKVWFWSKSPGHSHQLCFSCHTSVPSKSHSDHETKLELVKSKNSLTLCVGVISSGPAVSLYKCILTQHFPVIVDTIECKRRNCSRFSKKHFYNFSASVFITNPSAPSAFFLYSFELFATWVCCCLSPFCD